MGRTKKILGAVCAALLPVFSYAQQAPEVGAAMTASGFDCTFIVLVGPPGTFTPILPNHLGVFTYGILHVPMNDNTHVVLSNSSNGNRTLNCQGRLAFGDLAGGYDQGNWPAFATGTMLSIEEVCEATSLVAPDVCKGKKGPAVINSLTSFFQCRIPGVPGEGIPDAWTTKWRQILTPSGQISLNCSSKY